MSLEGNMKEKSGKKAIRFLIKMIEKCDKLAVAHKSKFEEKLSSILTHSIFISLPLNRTSRYLSLL